MAEEFQELYCHGCDMYVQFRIDMEKEGNHVLKCPNCGHEHCRVVRNGIITDERWDQRNGTYYVHNPTCTANSTYDTTSAGSIWAYTAWATASTTASSY